MNDDLIAALKHGAHMSCEILLGVLVLTTFVGAVLLTGYGILSLGSYLATKFSIWVAFPVCAVIVIFLFSAYSAVIQYFNRQV